jgi:serine/threonine-protein kinase
VQAFGRYQLIDHLASGGMADVYRAEAPGPAGFRKEVAIKVIRPGFGGRSDFIRMFINEAQLASRLNHANIVQVFDFDQVDGRYYIAMEFVRGRTLLEIMDACRERGLWLDLPQSLHVCVQVGNALSYAHRLTDGGRPLALVHRDVSPQNVLVSFEGEVKLADFGIAHAMGASGMTAPGIVKGKVAYMAPEQARAERVDPRADVFALGVVAWELCTGNDLFARDSDAASLAAVLGPQPVIAPPSNWNPKVSPELDRAVMAALERDRERRTGTAEDLATQLSEALLRVVKSSADTDLRKLMRRLWPEGAESVRPEGTAVSATAMLEGVWKPSTPPPAEAASAEPPTTLVLDGSRQGPPVGGSTKRLAPSPVGEPGGKEKRARDELPGRSGRVRWIAGIATLAAVAVVAWMVAARPGQAPVKERPAPEAQPREVAQVAAPVQMVPVAKVPAPVQAPAEPVAVVKPSPELHKVALGDASVVKKGKKKDSGSGWVAFLEVHVPSEATVYMNGRLLGNGGDLRSSHLKVTPGSHHLVVKMDESQAEEDVVLQAGQTYRFQLTPK